MSDSKHILIAGCGYLGEIIARNCLESGHSVTALKRDPSTLPAGISSRLAIDMSQPFELKENYDWIIFCAAPSSHDRASYEQTYVAGLRNLITAAQDFKDKPEVLFVSSTGVYGQDKGEQIDEEANTWPHTFSGEVMLDAEGTLETFHKDAIILRLGGIYGPGRIGIVDRFKQSPRLSLANPYTNRIHSWDAARAAIHLLTTGANRIFNGVDSEPVPVNNVRKWLSKELSIPLQAGLDETPPLHGSKRVLNDKLLGSGFELLYPSFREGFQAIFKENS